MEKRNKIIYWVATCWLALGMISTGMVQLLKVETEVENIIHYGGSRKEMSILNAFQHLLNEYAKQKGL